MMSTLTAKFQEIRARFLNMDLTTKRQHYSCRDDYIILDQIPSWDQYVTLKNIKPSMDGLQVEDLTQVAGAAEEHMESAISKDEEINSKVSLWQGDITRLEIDSILNAGNSSLLGGGGVDGSIHEAAGEDLLNECAALNGCETGGAKITGGYKLPAKYVIHAVGPTGQNATLLRSAYEASLDLVLAHNLKTVAFPCISTGIYGYPIEDASHVALLTVRKFLDLHKSKVERIIFTTYSDTDSRVYEELMLRYFPVK